MYLPSLSKLIYNSTPNLRTKKINRTILLRAQDQYKFK